MTNEASDQLSYFSRRDRFWPFVHGQDSIPITKVHHELLWQVDVFFIEGLLSSAVFDGTVIQLYDGVLSDFWARA